jgi:hypothetical protein
MDPVAYHWIAAWQLVQLPPDDKGAVLTLRAKKIHALRRPLADQRNHLDLRE